MCVKVGKADLANILLPPVKHETERVSEGQINLDISG